MPMGRNADNLVLDYAGVRVGTLRAEQRAQLLALIERFVGTMEEGHARVRMDEVAAHLDDTWFAWVGEVSDEAVFYYRIHSPVVLVEFDHQNPVGSRSINEPGCSRLNGSTRARRAGTPFDLTHARARPFGWSLKRG